ncbi:MULTISPECIES: S9 family peptidase [unclassified Microbacterium]|uniref:alpha/beta hydrolase family protein n=1 Tax=unclassified Microbacterium TaxID=2609290 RepID=UPI000CFCD096|nr:MULTISPECIES: alpha/beta fold hydrolase [unclassified Microbacterium]PQZ61045.1 lipase [Microbacterium sp. MYb43]PQZ82254.1 lipase [Microbacterium sp. MYb40]PRB24044.1 lipase [Microbacterium sp. MYb54]PRB30875.1 lipase [Microbacterium sp. MYb50]PRB70702.1 lipase [Microbacterium sp. MYb24]
MHNGDATPAAHARRPRRRRSALIIIGAILILALVLIAAEVTRRTLAEQQDARTDPAFYALPTPLPSGDPGEIIRIEPIESAPIDTTAWRVIYHSRDLAGVDIPVSGIVIVPDGPAPDGGRTVVSWGHPTTGAATQCAPSLGLDPFQYIEGMHELLAEGYAVVATDYPGLGVDGASSYLLGIPESNSVLDIVRAAQRIDDADVSDRVVLWGHSQGGQAVLFAAERAAEYAPELSVEGVAVAAPAANLNALMTDDIVNLSGVTIASFAIPAYDAAYAEQYGSSAITDILTPAGLSATPDMAALCLLTQNKEIHAIADPLVGGYVRSDPATTQPWQTMLQENSAGNSPIRVPVFVGQGEADQLVLPSATEGYVKLLCTQNADVTFHRYPGVTHGLAAYAALPDLLLWLPTLDGDRPSADGCG